MKIINDICVKIGQSDEVAIEKAKKIAGIDFEICKIFKKSLDARDKKDIKFVYSVKFYQKGEYEQEIASYDDFGERYCKKNPPIVVGFGPAGMLCALKLARCGAKPIVIERGSCVEKRSQKVQEFWNGKPLDTQCNVQFGEGGAGAFSDGKLTTNISSPLCRKVLWEFVQAGAPQEILYLSKPHLGTDNLPKIVKNIRQQILSLGGEILFDSTLTDITIENGKIVSAQVVCKGETKHIICNDIVFAIGHSSRDTFEMLKQKGIFMQQKPFAVGLRIEHKKVDIDKSQYGEMAKFLPSADYKLVYNDKQGSAYTFCMCPGGKVVGATSEDFAVVTNGMSEYARDFENSNSALLVGVGDFGDDVLAGIKFQRKLEHSAFLLGGENYFAPCQRVQDFLKNQTSTAFGKIKPSYLPGIKMTNLNGFFDDKIENTLKKALVGLNRKLNGFCDNDAILCGVESRTSSPIRIMRGQNFESISTKGLYPCGEGAGYAGGIMSAAVDGLKVAQAILQND